MTIMMTIMILENNGCGLCNNIYGLLSLKIMIKMSMYWESSVSMTMTMMMMMMVLAILT